MDVPSQSRGGTWRGSCRLLVGHEGALLACTRVPAVSPPALRQCIIQKDDRYQQLDSRGIMSHKWPLMNGMGQTISCIPAPSDPLLRGRYLQNRPRLACARRESQLVVKTHRLLPTVSKGAAFPAPCAHREADGKRSLRRRRHLFPAWVLAGQRSVVRLPGAAAAGGPAQAPPPCGPAGLGFPPGPPAPSSRL